MKAWLEKNALLSVCVTFLTCFLALCLMGRPLLPPDETRYLTVAWEMLVRNNFILPTLNYAPYHHKPPLLFWLINSMWQVFGLSDAPVRFMMMLITGLYLFLTYKVLNALQKGLGTIGVLVLLASPLFMIYATHIMFDILMSVFVLAAILALLKLADGARPLYWVVVGLALGIGGLAKGPAVLVHVVPLALLMPVWAKGARPALPAWYFGLFLSVVIGFLVALFWAIPAALQGGPDYARMIFYGQSTGRMVHAFDHARPLWWYLPIVPAFMALPLLLPQFWRGLKTEIQVKTVRHTSAFKFLACWFVPVFLAFSIMSGKQVHYLIPVLPALAGMLALVLQTEKTEAALKLLVAVSFIGLAVFFVGGQHKIALYSITPVGQALQNVPPTSPIAIDSKYDGEYGFVGRLKKPVTVLQKNEYATWFAANPTGVLIHRYRAHEEIHHFGYTELFEQQFRKNQEIGLYTAMKP